jgi:nucleoside-diphosphate-sugar epimerase
MMVETLLADSHHQLKEAVMYAITGIAGQVGGAVARALLAARLPVRAESPRNAAAAKLRDPTERKQLALCK